MGDARIVYGLALGKQGNWYQTWQSRTHGILGQADTTPDVTNGVLFYSANTSATTISNFDLSAPGSPNTGGNLAPLFEGKVIKVFFTDSVTTISGSRIYLASTNNTFNSNSWLGLVYHNSAWYETERSQVAGLNVSQKITRVGAANEALTVTSQDYMLVVVPTAAGAIVSGISGGYVGQRILLVSGSGTATFALSDATSSGAGNIFFVASNQLVFDTTNSTIELVKVSPVAWAIPSIVSA